MAKGPVPLARHLPVARVVIDSPLPHLDRPFDYSVPATMADIAVPGVRVRVRFAGRLLDAFILERRESSEFELAALHAVISPEVVLTSDVLELARAVASRWSGTLSDVLRSAVPSRHARAEAVHGDSAADSAPGTATTLREYVGGNALVTRTMAGAAPRALVTTGNDDVAALLAGYVHEVSAAGGVIVVAPDRAAVERVVAALERRGVAGVAMLLADDGPERRYRQWLRVLRGQARIAVGTRSAVFAPMHNLVAMCVWNEWEDSLCDPQAPYWNARDVAVLRSAQSNCALVLAGAAMSCEAVALRPWAAHICRSTAEVRERMPMVRAATGNRIPSAVLQALRKGLSGGPVLVTVVRAGYQPRLACDGCRELASCSYCQGPLIRTSRSSDPSCAHCGQIATSWSCPWCSVTRLRAPSPGSERTAEELGRAFPGVPVRSSSGDSIVRTIDSRPSIVVATAGAIPVAAGGYTAAAILDGDMMLARPDLRATEDAFARWSEVVASVRSAGEVVVVAASEHPAVQALIRHDPMGLAERELHARETVQLPPACRVVALTGSPEDVSALAVDVSGAHVRGPVPVGDGKVRLLLSTSKADGARLVAQVRAATVARAAGRKGGVVNVRVDPRDL